MENQALIFIPDISGFTKFMTHCKLDHSRQILFRLIDIILASNQIGLELSEIEGDAVLFYLKEGCPEPEVMVRQAKKTFLDFHSSLASMEDTLFCGCGCGACTTAADLTLKFIVHYGTCREVPFNGFMKLIGGDVILAHRLLKTAVPEREYILFSDQYLKRTRNQCQNRGWADCRPYRETIEDFGEIPMTYVPLSPLRASNRQPGTPGTHTFRGRDSGLRILPAC